jgi:hypothetical protein
MTDKKMSTGAACALILALLATVPLRAYTVSKLWLWFMVPALNVKPLGLALALGLSLFLGYVTYNPNYVCKHTTNQDGTVQIYAGVFLSLFALASGWLITLFI